MSDVEMKVNPFNGWLVAVPTPPTRTEPEPPVIKAELVILGTDRRPCARYWCAPCRQHHVHGWPGGYVTGYRLSHCESK